MILQRTLRIIGRRVCVGRGGRRASIVLGFSHAAASSMRRGALWGTAGTRPRGMSLSAYGSVRVLRSHADGRDLR